MTADACARWLSERDGFLIISHKRPDGDTLCSGAALCSALRRVGKTAYCFDNPETTKNYVSFVADYAAPAGFAPAFSVTVDVADTGLFPAGISLPVDLAIDHHPSNSGFAGELCLDGTRSSCGELIFDIIRRLCGDVTPEEANLLYIALSTDTGCFCYMNTNAGSFRAAAELVDLGARNDRLNNLFFRSMSKARITLEGLIYSGLRYLKGGRVVVSVVTPDMLERAGATEDDCEDLAGIPGKAEGSWLSVTVRQLEPAQCKISLRSKPAINCSAICAVFGGGGHAMAAGCTIDREPEEALAMILAEVDNQWPAD